MSEAEGTMRLDPDQMALIVSMAKRMDLMAKQIETLSAKLEAGGGDSDRVADRSRESDRGEEETKPLPLDWNAPPQSRDEVGKSQGGRVHLAPLTKKPNSGSASNDRPNLRR